MEREYKRIINLFAQLNGNMIFDPEPHEYLYLPTNKKFISTTQLLKLYQSDFLAKAISMNMFKYRKEIIDGKEVPIIVNGEKVKIPYYERNKLSNEQMDKWDKDSYEASVRGDNVHYYNDCIAKGKEFKNYKEKYKGYYETSDIMWKEFFHKLFTYFISESLIYDVNYEVAGTLDNIAINKHGIFLYDYKTGENLDKVYGKFKEPINDFKDTKMNRYALQLSLYNYMCSKWSIDIKELYIMQVTEKEYKPYKVEYLKDKIIKILEHYKQSKKPKKNKILPPIDFEL